MIFLLHALFPHLLDLCLQYSLIFHQKLNKIWFPFRYVHKLPAECRRIIDELSERCRLESLTLCVGTIITKNILYAKKPRQTDLEAIASLVSKAFRLQSFNLRSWPIYPGLQSVNILENLVGNPKLSTLESLSLYYQNPETATWASLNAILPSPENILLTMEHFQYLKCLRLRSTMLSEDIILELGKSYHAPLERLAVFVTYSRHDDEGGVPWISDKAWLKLKQRSPDLKVEFSIMTRMPFVELAGLLKPEIPVSSLGFMRYSRCDTQDIQSIADKYHATLQKFVCLLSELEDADEALLSLVNKCSNLNYFVFHGVLRCATVLALAESRNKDWLVYELMEENILTDNEAESLFQGEGERQIVGQRESGEYYLLRSDQLRLEQQSEAERDGILVELSARVSGVLEQRWFPLSSGVITERLTSGHAGSIVVPEKFLLNMQAANDPANQPTG